MTDWLTWEGDIPGIGGGALTADIVKQITASAESEVTNHPIEDGSEISDHVIHRPRRVTFEFAQSATPLGESETEWKQLPIDVRQSQFKPTGLLAITMLAGAAVAAIGAALGIGGGPAEVWTLTAKEDKDRIHALHDKLIEVWQKSSLCTFNYQGLQLSDYVLTSVQYSRGVPGGVVRFTIEAQAIVTAATAGATLGAAGVGAPIPAAVNLVPLVPGGPSAVEKLEKAVVQKSMLASGLDALGI